MLGERSAARRALAQLRYLDQVLKESLRLWPTAPGVRASQPRARHGARRRLPVRREDDAAGARADAAPRPGGLGRRRRSLRPGPVRRRTRRAAPAERVEAVRQRRSAPASAARSRCRRRRSSWRCCCSASTSCSADPAYQLKIKRDADDQAATASHPCTRRGDRRHRAAQRAAAAQVAARPPTRPAPVASDGVADPGAVSARNAGSCEAFAQRIASDAPAHGLRADGRAARRARGPAAHRGRRRDASRPPTRASRPTTRGSSCAGCDGLAARRARRRAVRRVRLRQHGLGAHLPGHPQARSTQASPRAGATRTAYRAARPMPAATSSATSTTGTPGSGADLSTALGRAAATSAPAAEPLLEVEFVGGARDPLLRAERPGSRARSSRTASWSTWRAAVPGPSGTSRSPCPQGMTYRAGDYLAVLPLNPAARRRPRAGRASGSPTTPRP